MVIHFSKSECVYCNNRNLQLIAMGLITFIMAHQHETVLLFKIREPTFFPVLLGYNQICGLNISMGRHRPKLIMLKYYFEHLLQYNRRVSYSHTKSLTDTSGQYNFS